ncbi:ATP-binding protein [Candidatus Methylospira mobilis]|nr:ATP-binding protein [Candidatus Methylospira mobilis]
MSAEELMMQVAEISRKAAQTLADERKANRQRHITEMLRRSALPRRFSGARMMDCKRTQAPAYAQAREFISGFRARLETGSGMVVWGDVGTGKTHLVCAIANELIAQGHSAMYCTALEAVTLVKSTWKRGSNGLTEYDVYGRFGDPELLIMDEIGVQMGSDFERMVLTSIADTRSRNCMPTIIVSNLDLSGIYELIGERMFDRLVGFDAKIVRMEGRSLRLNTVAA